MGASKSLQKRPTNVDATSFFHTNFGSPGTEFLILAVPHCSLALGVAMTACVCVRVSARVYARAFV
jgi:hypothetical protein